MVPTGEVKVVHAPEVAFETVGPGGVSGEPYPDRMMVLLAVRFLAEIGMLVCLGIGGWQLGDSLLASLALSVVLPLAAAAVWGRWVAPRASRRLREPARLGVEVTLFAAALLAVMRAHPSPAMPVVGLAVWAAFLASIPARKYEPALPPAGLARGMK